MPRPRARMGAGGSNSVPSFVAYYRVSTDGQGRSGLGLDAQRAAVAQQVNAKGGRLVEEFEEQESGKRNDRPELARALASCRARRAILVIAKLDRLARNALFLLTVAEGTGDGGVVFCDLPQLPPGPVGKFIVTVMAAVAELEAGLISQRTVDALAQVKAAIERDGGWTARRSGRWITRLGGPNLVTGQADIGDRGRDTQSARSHQRALDVLPFIEDARNTGAGSIRAIAAKLTLWGIAPPSGGDRWHSSQVTRVLRLEQQLKTAAPGGQS
jgi:DNA invertase Pin-like site-specific DNA recombinase